MAKAKIEIHQTEAALAAHAAATTGVHGVGAGINPNFEEVWESGDILSTANADTSRNIWVEDGFLYAVCNVGSRLAIYDIHDITTPVQLSLTNITWGTIGGIDIRKKGDFLFISGYYGIQVIDVSRPQYPSVVVQFNINNTPVHGMFLRGNVLYCCQLYVDKFVLVDVSNPLSPSKMSELSGATYFNGVHDVFVDEKYAYVSNHLAGTGEYGLTVVDISNPYNPTVVTGVGENCKQSSILKRGRYLFCGSHPPDSGIRIFDAQNPTSPVLLGNFLTESEVGNCYWMSWYGDYIVAVGATIAKTVSIIDVTNPLAPVIADSLVLATQNVRGLFVWGKYAFVSLTNVSGADYHWRLCILEIEQGFVGSSRDYQLWLQGKRAYELAANELADLYSAYESSLVDAISRSNFMMLPTNAGWSTSHTGSGGGTQTPFYLSVTTGTTASSRGLLSATPYGFGVGYYFSTINYDKKFVIVANIGRYYSDSESIARFQLKPTATGGALDAKGIGLKVVNYALWGESYGTSLDEVDLATTLTNLYGYQIKIVHTPGVSIEWYVDGVLKGTQTDTAKIPSGYSGTPYYAVISIINGATGGVNCSFFFMQGKIWQAR